MRTHTHTIATLDVPKEMWDYIAKQLRDAGYDHAFDGKMIDMTGIGLVAKPLYKATLKTRAEMERDIPRELLGWWHDVCPGATLTLRDATADDVARCTLVESASRNPADYLCENFDRGCLVNRAAIADLQEIQ
ncbi:hypothetical protein [Burkholderia sp. Ac-20349]|uniref:hypothetical protein n=1 Tax=Burkholderia sp. Ac-20349 TaxID=2703893 RepID=UPI00197C9EEC|nr:hypothetical protein [Burkholderia sp. Ac-20349]MBN3839318.1 hypothetical protein [Burkholderia sp. Ac-20349]